MGLKKNQGGIPLIQTEIETQEFCIWIMEVCEMFSLGEPEWWITLAAVNPLSYGNRLSNAKDELCRHMRKLSTNELDIVQRDIPEMFEWYQKNKKKLWGKEKQQATTSLSFRSEKYESGREYYKRTGKYKPGTPFENQVIPLSCKLPVAEKLEDNV